MSIGTRPRRNQGWRSGAFKLNVRALASEHLGKAVWLCVGAASRHRLRVAVVASDRDSSYDTFPLTVTLTLGSDHETRKALR